MGDPLAVLAKAAEGRESLDEEEMSNRATTPAPMESEAENGELCDLSDRPPPPHGHFAPIPIGCPVEPPRIPTPVFKPAPTAGVQQQEGARGVQPVQPVPTQAFSPYVFPNGMSIAQPVMHMPMMQTTPMPMPMIATVVPMQLVHAQAQPLLPARPVMAHRAISQRLALANMEESRCLGRLIRADGSCCDPHFTAPVGGTLRFEHKFCNRCRAEGVQVLASRVRLLHPDHEASLGSPGFSHTQQRRFWSYAPIAPARFHLFNDKARCTGAKIVVFEKPLEATDACGDCMLEELPASEKSASGEAAVRLWVSYGTLTLQRSRKAFKPNPPPPPSMAQLAHAYIV